MQFFGSSQGRNLEEVYSKDSELGCHLVEILKPKDNKLVSLRPLNIFSEALSEHKSNNS